MVVRCLRYPGASTVAANHQIAYFIAGKSHNPARNPPHPGTQRADLAKKKQRRGREGWGRRNMQNTDKSG